VDTHKRSHTAVVLDDCEEIASQIRVNASIGEVTELLAWAQVTKRVWAVENANGLGRLLACQLVAAGESVIGVPATLASRARKLSGKSGRKTDEFDARSVAIAARHNRGLRHVAVENVTAVVGPAAVPGAGRRRQHPHRDPRHRCGRRGDHPGDRRRPDAVPDQGVTSPRSPAPHRSKRPPVMRAATGCPGAATGR
jgi:hypothetical protein